MKGFRKGGEIRDVTDVTTHAPKRTERKSEAASFYEGLVGASTSGQGSWRDGSSGAEAARDGGTSGGAGAYARVGEQPTPAEAALAAQLAAGRAAYSIPRRNVGYQLLRKAGWREGQGLGAEGQGRHEPLKAAVNPGRRGLGAADKGSKPKAQQQQQQAAQAGGAPVGGAHAPGIGPEARPGKRAPHTNPLEVDTESLESKRWRHQQMLQIEADEAAGRAIQRYIFNAFNDSTGEPTADDNPLLRRGRGRHKLSATNPLL